MKYKIGDVFTFTNGEKGKVVKTGENIAGEEEYDINVNGKIRSIIIDENGQVNYD